MRLEDVRGVPIFDGLSDEQLQSITGQLFGKADANYEVLGKMAALSCGSEQAAKLVQAIGGRTLQIAVVNHDRQTVISGDDGELNKLGEAAARQRIGQHRLGRDDRRRRRLPETARRRCPRR